MIYDLERHINATPPRVGWFIFWFSGYNQSEIILVNGGWSWTHECVLICACADVFERLLQPRWTHAQVSLGTLVFCVNVCSAAALHRTQTQREINCRSWFYWTGSMLFSFFSKSSLGSTALGWRSWLTQSPAELYCGSQMMIEMPKSHKCSLSDENRNRTRMIQDFLKIQFSQTERLHSGISGWD